MAKKPTETEEQTEELVSLQEPPNPSFQLKPRQVKPQAAVKNPAPAVKNDAPKVKKVVAPDPTIRQKVVFKKDRETRHDLFKLEHNTCLKNTSFDKENPIWDNVEHCHFFHTVDSKGKAQTSCTYVGGHYHKIIELAAPTDDSPGVYEVSPPLKRISRRNKMTRREEIVEVPYSANDRHTHDMTYMRSEVLKQQKINPEFVKWQADPTVAAPQALDGIL